jgi:hypothetical protein
MDLIVRGAAVSLFLSAVAAAGPKSLAIASGECRDGDLNNGATAFADAVKGQLKADAMDGAAVLERLRPRPLAGLDETGRQIDAAQSQFYSNQLDHSLEVTRSALKSLERIAPSDAAFKQIAAARVLEGLVLKGQGKKNEQTDAWKRILRVQPEFALDTDYYTPATIQQFDALKKEMARGKRVPLSVQSTPAGATVFLDGAPVGKTPFKGAFPAGSYRLTLAQGDAQSFVYDVTLEQPFDKQIDLGFESTLYAQLPLCVRSSTADYDRALRLAAIAGAERALVVRVESHNNEPGWVAAVLLDVQKGARVREGGMKVSDAKKGSGYADLVSFVLTGEPAKLSLGQATAGAPEPQPWNPPVAAVSESAADPGPVAVETASASPGLRLGVGRIAALAAIGVGAITGIIGLGVYLGGGDARYHLGLCLTPDGSYDPSACPGTLQNVMDLSARVSDNRNTSLVLGGIGLAAVAAGAVLFFVLPAKDAPAVSAMVTPQGAVVGLSGRLP